MGHEISSLMNDQKKIINYSLSLQDTMLIKGLAICFMLWHHLFYTHQEFGSFVNQTAQIGKVCVAMFLFVSGYGLSVSFGKLNVNSFNETSKIVKFLLKRYLKFYVNYWVVFFLFVPIGIFLFQRSLTDAYGLNVNILKRFFFDFLGIQGFNSYNITWWFNQLIICLYMLFPFLYLLIKRWCIPVLLFFLLLLRFHQIQIPVVHDWLFHFSIGIAYALNVDKISNFMGRINMRSQQLISIILIGLFILLRQGIFSHWSGIRIDGFLTLAIVLFVINTFRYVKFANFSFGYLGKQAMNIYMIHTFIFYYWFSNVIYSLRYPVLIFFALLLISLFISITIEFIKNKIGVYSLIKSIEKKYLNDTFQETQPHR